MSEPIRRFTSFTSHVKSFIQNGGQGNSKGASDLARLAPATQKTRWLPANKESTKRQGEARNTSAMGIDTTVVSPTPQWTLSGDAAVPVPVKREHLWDEAYDNLRLDLPELVSKYEEILSLDIEAMAAESPIQGSSSTAPMKTSISQTDLKSRWHQMCCLLSWWLNNRDRGRDSRQSNQLQDLLRDHVRKSTSGKSPGALAWVCVCYASQVLLHPPLKTEAICPGLLDIISRMNWYNCLPRLIVSGDTDVLLQEEQVLRSRVVDLYKEVLSYLMNAVLPTGCQFDSWDSSLARLKEAEDNLLTFSEGFVVQQLDGFLMLARENEKRQISPRIKETMSLRGEINEKLARLGRVDTASSVTEPQSRNGLLAHELCQWICSTENYRSFVNWNAKDIKEKSFSKNITGNTTSQILLISGGPGLNKTALLEAIVRHLSNEAILEEFDVVGADPKAIPWAVSYYSCGRTSHGIANSASVLRSLIHSLLRQQPKLISHLAAALGVTGRRQFDSPKDFFALLRLFFSMLDDGNFVRSYLVIDGIDECSSEHGRDVGRGRDLDDLILLIEATAHVPHKIKWLLSADINAGIEIKLMKGRQFQYISLVEAHQARKLAGIFHRNIIYMVNQLAKERRYTEQTKKELSRLISDRSQENALWAVIACTILRKEDSWHAVEALKEMPERLDEMYEYVRVNLKTLPRQDPEFCKSMLSIMATVRCPLLVSELVRLAEIPPQVDPLAIIEKCLLLEVQSGIVKFIDPAARQDTWQQLHQNLTEVSEVHSYIASKALRFLSAHFETVTSTAPGLNRGQNQSRKVILPDAYGNLHWITHLLHVKDIAKDAEIVDLVICFMKNHFLLWLDAITFNGLHVNAAALMKKLESVLLKQAREEKSELMKIQDFKQSKGEILEQLEEKQQSHILSLVRDAIQVIRSHNSMNGIFSTHPNSVIFYPDGSAFKQDWMAKNKTWLVTPPRTARSWSDSPLILADSNHIQSIAFSPDGRLLASGSARSSDIRVWDAETGTAQLILSSLKENRVHYVAFSPNGQLVSVSENGIFHLWDLSTGRSLKVSPVQQRKVTAIRFSPNGEKSEKLVLATSEALLLWNFSDFGNPTYTEDVIEEGSSVYAVDFSQRGTLIASGGKGGDVKVWDAQHSNAPLRTLQGHKGDVNSVAFSRDEKRLVSGSNDLTIRIWSVEIGANLKSFDCGYAIYGVAYSPDDSFIAAGCNDQVMVWESDSGAQRYVMRGHDQPVRTITFLPQGYLASGSEDKTIRLWDLEGAVRNDTNALSEPVSDNPISLIAVSPDGKYLASASGQSLYLGDGMTGVKTISHKLLKGVVLSISFSPDGKRLVSSSRDGIVSVWDVTSGTIYRTFHGHSNWVSFAAFSPDGNYVASASYDNTVRIWSCLAGAEGEDPIVLWDHSSCVSTVAFSPDGKLLVSGDLNSNLIIWDRKFRISKHRLIHSGNIKDVIFSQDSSRIVSRSDDYSLCVWDSMTGNLIQGPLRTGRTSRHISFDLRMPEYILTEYGVDPSTLEPTPFPVPKGQKAGRYGVAKDGDWITWNGKKIIPIPEKYRPTASWVQGNIVAIGTNWGKVLLFRFSTEVEPPN